MEIRVCQILWKVILIVGLSSWEGSTDLYDFLQRKLNFTFYCELQIVTRDGLLPNDTAFSEGKWEIELLG
jgi:hypothetical protein